MTVRAFFRFLKGVRDRILLIVHGIVGPPYQALRRVLLRWRDRIDALIQRLLTWWANIFQSEPRKKRANVDPASAATLLLAAAVTGLALYTWPAQRVLGTRDLVLAAIVVWAVASLVIARMSRADSFSRHRLWLRQAARRTGLMRWERLGAAAAVGLFPAAVARRPAVVPLAMTLVVGFVRLLAIEYRERELRRLPSVPPPPEDDTPHEGVVDHVFRWDLRIAELAEELSMTVPVNTATFHRLKDANPGRAWDGNRPLFNRWVVDGATREVDLAAWRLRQMADDRSFSTFREVSNVLAWVQSVEYSLDSVSVGAEDYWRYPIETMHEETGDCEDTSILAATVLRRLGHRVALALMPGHVAIGVEVPPGTPGTYALVDGHRMYFCETTATGMRVGQLPEDLRTKEITWYPVPIKDRN